MPAFIIKSTQSGKLKIERPIWTLEQYTRKYKELYALAQAVFDKYNPCEPHPDGTCIRTRVEPKYTKNPADRCCQACEFHSRERGCLTMSLSCKLWTCGLLNARASGGDNYPKLKAFFAELNPLSFEFRRLPVIPGARESFLSSVRLMADYLIRNKFDEEDE